MCWYNYDYNDYTDDFQTLSTVTLRLFEASTISIEIFLLISGTVATYTFFVKKEKQQQLPLWKSYLIRYFR